MANLLTVQVMSDVDYEDLIAEGYVNDRCLFVVSQENGFDNLEVEFLSEAGVRVLVTDAVALLELCKQRLWELRRTESPNER